jgi:hypothetical protein
MYTLIGIAFLVYVCWYWCFGPGRGHTLTPPKRRSSKSATWAFGYKPGKMVPKPGWWEASDGKWYPPHQHPNRRRLPPPPR